MKRQRVVHGAFSDLATHRLYEFSETSSGDTIIKRWWFQLVDFATVKGSGVYQVMNTIDVRNLYYSEKRFN